MKNNQPIAHNVRRSRLPEWMRRRVSLSSDVLKMKNYLHNHGLNTVCESAGCPNLSYCFQKSTATFMILGHVCTRHCRFCGVCQGKPVPVDENEPIRVAESVQMLGLSHVVITSVTRDDLPDGGAFHFVSTIKAVKKLNPNTTVEVLIPDFQGNAAALKCVLDCCIDVLNHNVETVPRLYPSIRPEADFDRSMKILSYVKKYRSDVITKSGFMLGLGETEEEIIEVLNALRQTSCDGVTIGQYLTPALNKAKVRKYLHPVLFQYYQKMAEDMGFKCVTAGPYVRSSYEADEMLRKIRGAKT
ncbi:lipoyl synthase [bacterium]|nr:lipoyl synthase [bacterium]